MRIYLDNCCFNRPFDDQTQARIHLETEAILEIQQRIQDHRLELAWSYLLDFENQANPFKERFETIARWKNIAVVDQEESMAVLQRAKEFLERGVRPKDALHIACAIAGGCGCLLTTDDLLLKKMRGFSDISVMDPTQFIIEVE